MPTLPNSRYVSIHVTQNTNENLDCPRRFSSERVYYWRTLRGDVSNLFFLDYASAVIDARCHGYYVRNENRRWNKVNKGN